MVLHAIGACWRSERIRTSEHVWRYGCGVANVDGQIELHVFAAMMMSRLYYQRRTQPHLPRPNGTFTVTMQRTSNNAGSLTRFPSSSSSRGPPLTLRAIAGTSKTRFATPSSPGCKIYSGPRNETEVNVSEIWRGCFCVGGIFGNTSSRVRETDKPVF